jgi:hypothetical protein
MNDHVIRGVLVAMWVAVYGLEPFRVLEFWSLRRVEIVSRV